MHVNQLVNLGGGKINRYDTIFITTLKVTNWTFCHILKVSNSVSPAYQVLLIGLLLTFLLLPGGERGWGPPRVGAGVPCIRFYLIQHLQLHISIVECIKLGDLNVLKGALDPLYKTLLHAGIDQSLLGKVEARCFDHGGRSADVLLRHFNCLYGILALIQPWSTAWLARCIRLLKLEFDWSTWHN